MTEFTPFSALIGGALIGCAAVIFMLTNGRIAGISGIVSGLFAPSSGNDFAVRAAFVIGLIAAPLAWQAGTGTTIAQLVSPHIALMTVAGVLVGFGSVFGNGCTSGHGVCGLARLSVRSLAATATFMVTAAVTVFVVRHMVGG